MEHYATVEEAAAQLGLSVATIQRYCRLGLIRAEKHISPLSNRTRRLEWRIPQGEISRHIASAPR